MGIQIKTDECEARKQIILIYRVEIAVPIKDRLCRSALNMRSNAYLSLHVGEKTQVNNTVISISTPLKHCATLSPDVSRIQRTKSKPFALHNKFSNDDYH